MPDQVLTSGRKKLHKAEATATAQPSKAEARKLEQLRRKRESQARLAGAHVSSYSASFGTAHFCGALHVKQEWNNVAQCQFRARHTESKLVCVRAEACKRLQSSQLDSSALAALTATTQRGGATSHAQAQARRDALASAGVTLPANSHLKRKRGRRGEQLRKYTDAGRGSDSSERSDISQSSDDEKSGEAVQASQHRSGGLHAPALNEQPGSTKTAPQQADSKRASTDGAAAKQNSLDIVDHADNAQAASHTQPQSRDLSSAKPPISVTFGKRKQSASATDPAASDMQNQDVGGGADALGNAAQPGRAAVQAQQRSEARKQAAEARQELQAAGHLAGVQCARS